MMAPWKLGGRANTTQLLVDDSGHSAKELSEAIDYSLSQTL
jgi:hypothetical protein